LAEEIKSSTQEVPDSCPHCGNKLSPWQQVLLATDRALVCRNCWYRIILDVIPTTKKTEEDKSKNKGSN
jgi:DNA-directed RNA polymerase subunit RPC12/RpoP